jgi:hydrogenase expression/formation protein HypE
MDENRSGVNETFSCPLPLKDYPNILLAHGSGGKLTQQLIHEMFLKSFNNPHLRPLHDGAIIKQGDVSLAFTTDAYVIDPIFFPGGDIGKLAVNGTVNDLAMCGARPMWLSAAFIIEEGFPMNELSRIVGSMKEAAVRAGVMIVTGDTKVVDKGKGDKIFITTSGVGLLENGLAISPEGAQPGDKIILSGNIAVHGIAIMSVREGLQFETQVMSDTAPLNDIVASISGITKNIHVLRDPTRGGIASALNEIAQSSHLGISITQNQIPIPEEVDSACELLGLDPLYVANEGIFLAFVSMNDADKVLACMRKHPLGKNAAIIGEVVAEHPDIVVMKTSIGGSRIVDMLSGEQLPRIC